MARFNTGWFKCYRGAWEKDLGKNIHLWALWHALLHMAHWKESDEIWRGERRVLPPGTVILGIKEIADRWGCSQRTISKWLHYLHDTRRIVLETCALGTLVTICNWEKYQATETEACADDAQDVRTTAEPGLSKVGLIEEVLRKGRTISRRKSPEYSAEFETLYNQYPRKEGKASGFKVYSKLGSDERERLSVAIRNYADQCQREGREQRFIKQFSSFMSNWQDYESVSAITANSPAGIPLHQVRPV